MTLFRRLLEIHKGLRILVFKQILFFFLIPFVLSCQQKKFQSPPGYDLNKPEVKKMNSKLLEISGITFINDKSDTLLAINDEEGELFYFLFDATKTNNKKFTHKSGDYEDITVFGNSIYVLESNGTLIQFSKELNIQEINATKYKSGFPKGEYESIYADEENNRLYVLCKECPETDKASIIGYSVELKENTWQNINAFSIDLSSLDKKYKKNFKASAMTKNKRTQEWFILSSVDHLLLVTDLSFHVKASYPINPEIFNQPEGITFDETGNLYISNEGSKVTPGTILKFKLN